MAHEAQYGGKSCSLLSEHLNCNEHKCMPRDCSHVHCLMEEVNVVTAKNETLTGFKVKVTHDKAEQNGWHHTCGRDPTHINDCRCTCKHTIHEWDPLHLSTQSKKMAVKQLLANAAAY